MIRNVLLFFVLACSTLTTACVETEDPQGPRKSGQDDPDFETEDEEPGDEGYELDCHAQIQDDEELPYCRPKA